MKKTILSCIMALFAITASAQFYVGGTLGISTEKVKINDVSAKNTLFSIAPEFGFNFNEFWAVGGTMDISYAKTAGTATTGFGLVPYARYTFAHTRLFDFFVEGAFGYQFIKMEETKMNGLDLLIRPGLLAKISPRVHLLAKMNLIDYSYVTNSDIDLENFGFAVGNKFSVGVVYNF